ncbi:flagellar biosynthesis protein FlgL [Methylobacterium sp. Leaf104]|uniref:flagellar hook-associated family protein n=1 Tax=Methylobacterium TaxID=407 RepID=UPI0006F2E573|nr:MULTISPECIES: flagellar hook-associated family protein [Methylobacterium]KQP29911.1 flagellar biosynthesis protein FlgL [Methylobacterium sp. Leaf104]MCI9882395.1 flagellar hook-associated family protein [Methylobacterium goesingense]
MRTNALSTLSFWNAPRIGVSRMRSDMAQASQELVTGRYADVGLALGSRSGLAVGLRQKIAELAALREGNNAATLRLGTTQAVLKQMQAGADATLTALTGTPEARRAGVLKDIAASGLVTLTALLNTSAGGQFVFGGTRTAEAPVTAYAGSPASPAKTAVDAAFQAAFGMSQDSPGASAITAADMASFLDGPAFQGLFDAGAWSTDWSGAGSAPLTSQISLSETVTTSVSANAPALRKLAMAYVMASDLGAQNLSAAAQNVLTTRVAGLLGQASQGLITLQADLGRSQAAITGANTRLESQQTLLQSQIGEMEGVDTAEAKTRSDRLSTQVQISYALTAQLRQLSLVNYL